MEGKKTIQTEEQQTKDDFIMLPTVDVCFVGLMENEQVRKSVCAAALGVPQETIGEIVMINRDLKREYANDKLGILDARVKFRNGDQMNLEMQVISFTHWNNRSLFYLCKMFAGQLEEGQDYGELKKCIQISILNFQWFTDDEYFWHRVRPIDEITGECYNENFELQVWELPKLEKAMKKYETDSVKVLLQRMRDSGDRTVEKYMGYADIFSWMQFFSGKKKEDFRMMAKTNKDMKSAYETLKKMSADEEKRLQYVAREKAIRDHISLVNDARRAKEKLETAEKKYAETEKKYAETEKKYAETEKKYAETEKQLSAAQQRNAELEQEIARLTAALTTKNN